MFSTTATVAKATSLEMVNQGPRSTFKVEEGGGGGGGRRFSYGSGKGEGFRRKLTVEKKWGEL